jgi:hypothetical protein
MTPGPFPLCEQRLFDMKAVVARTQVSARTWRRIIAAGWIGVLRIEGSVRIPEVELEQYLARQFVPAVKVRGIDPETVESLVNIVVARRRGRPRIAGGPAA